MTRNILGPSIFSCCLLGVGCFHLYISWKSSKYNDANLNVSELLKKNNFQIVSFDDKANSTWDEIVKKYKKVPDSEKLSQIKQNAKDDEIRGELKKNCEAILRKPTNSLDIYNQTIRWCCSASNNKLND